MSIWIQLRPAISNFGGTGQKVWDSAIFETAWLPDIEFTSGESCNGPWGILLCFDPSADSVM